MKIFRESYTLFSVCRSCTVATLTILSILSFQLNAASLPQVASVTVKTRAPQNELVTIWYRVPKNYRPHQEHMSRVLVLFGGRNSSGKDMASGGLEWGKWAEHISRFSGLQRRQLLGTGNVVRQGIAQRAGADPGEIQHLYR